MRNYISFNINNPLLFKKQLIEWTNNYSHSVVLNSNDFKSINKSEFAHHSYDLLAGIGIRNELKSEQSIKEFEKLKKKIDQNNDWWFGYFTYDLKNEFENLTSDNIDLLDFPTLYFIQPKLVFILNDSELKIEYFANDFSVSEIKNILYTISNVSVSNEHYSSSINSRISKEEYIENVNHILNHIQVGDIYELNYCQEFYCENISIKPTQLYQKLNTISPTPFSCYLNFNQYSLMSASPERYIKKEGNSIISQPIKGTIKRGKTKLEDKQMAEILKNSEKDLAENVMIVDLVRNDLSRIAEKVSVKVKELCGIYKYSHVHQMISTIEAKQRTNIHPLDAIKHSFPMGSMTGAPKIKAMQLIEKYEKTKRGLYSGAVGYIDPDYNYDFNVVIRSILYNEKHKYLSFSVGGAITRLSNPEDEYNECLLKAEAINKVLANEN